MYELILRQRLRHNIEFMNLNCLFGALRLFQPISIIYFAEITGNYAAAMGVFSIACIAQVLSEVPMGIISDRYGRKAVMILGCIAEFIAVLFYALAATPPVFDGWHWLYLGGILFGISEACFSGTIQAILYETLSYYKKTNLMPHILGRNSSMGQIGLAVSGIAAAALLWIGFDYQAIIYFTLIPALFCILSAFMLVEPPTQFMEKQALWFHAKQSFKTLITHRHIRLLAAAEIVKQGTGNASNSFMPQFIALVWPNWAVPLYRLGQNGIGAISFWVSGALVQKFGAHKVFILSDAVTRIMSLIAYMSTAVFSPFLLMLGQVGYALGMTSNESLKQQHFTDQERATLSSFMAFGSSIFSAVITLLLGLIADTLTPMWALVIILLFGAPSLIIYKQLYRQHKKGLGVFDVK